MRAQGRREEKNRSESGRDGGGDEEELKLVGDKESFWMGEGGEGREVNLQWEGGGERIMSQQVAGGSPAERSAGGIWKLE